VGASIRCGPFIKDYKDYEDYNLSTGLKEFLEFSLQCSQKPTTVPYSKTNATTPHFLNPD
jgi:hypothetical protein